ncbi:MAG: bifunctional phosphoribosylaminoimidazolecarboxamide formyltransferase/IMP cyclohydrolase [Defluviitaleaceae bacterium]|nr:bifunctional phosphoribosylaminoimidazolecarboxamide formyltransferase/IMP cyclohydrolase [Defluviitaleaceae bacterium]
MKKRALLQVSDQKGIVDFAQVLVMKGYELISTGETYKTLIENRIAVQNMYELTGFKEILDGRVRTLHPNIYGGILADRENISHMKDIIEHNIEFIDLVVANMYSFVDSALREDSYKEVIEAISIETASLIRASAKNHNYITVIVDSEDYYRFIYEIDKDGSVSLETRKKFAAKAFRYTASYDAVVSKYLTEEEYPEKLTLVYNKVREANYSEDSYKTGAIYEEVVISEEASLSNFIGKAKRIKGGNASFDILRDSDLALSLVSEFLEPTAVVVKNLNPIAVASSKVDFGGGNNLYEAVTTCFSDDSIFYSFGVAAFNRIVELEVATFLSKNAFLDENRSLKLILAPDFSEEAIQILNTHENLILLSVDTSYKASGKKISSIGGGILLEEADLNTSLDINILTEKQPSSEEIEASIYANTIFKYSKATSAVISDGNSLLGIGAGQASIKKASQIAFEEAKIKERTKGAVLAVDSHFFDLEVIKRANKEGISCIVSPGVGLNSKELKELIEACNEYSIAMIFTGVG